MGWLLEAETDRAVVAWVRIKLWGDRGVDVARALGYKDGSGVTRAVQRIDRQRMNDGELNLKLQDYENKQ